MTTPADLDRTAPDPTVPDPTVLDLTAAPDAPVVVLLSTYDEGELDHRGSGATAYINKSTFGPERLTDVWASRTIGNGHPDRQD